MPIPGLPPAPPAPPAPVPLPPPVPVERIDITWITPDGEEWPLAIPSGVIRAQATNSLSAAAPVEVTTDPSPRGGVVIRHIQALERFIILPILVTGNTHQELIDRWRALGDAFMRTIELGDGTLRVRRPDGSTRLINASYYSGWEGIPEQGWRWDIAPALTLIAAKPWWRAAEPLAVKREFSAGADYYSPYRTVSSGQVLGETTIVNPGEVTAWPAWTITGPLDELVAHNHRTGESFTLDPNWDGGGSLSLGETVTISTDPIRVRGPAGEIWTGAINGTLWGLERGSNHIEFIASGAAAGTSVELAFHPLYRTG